MCWRSLGSWAGCHGGRHLSDHGAGEACGFVCGSPEGPSLQSGLRDVHLDHVDLVNPQQDRWVGGRYGRPITAGSASHALPPGSSTKKSLDHRHDRCRGRTVRARRCESPLEREPERAGMRERRRECAGRASLSLRSTLGEPLWQTLRHHKLASACRVRDHPDPRMDLDQSPEKDPRLRSAMHEALVMVICGNTLANSSMSRTCWASRPQHAGGKHGDSSGEACEKRRWAGDRLQHASVRTRVRCVALRMPTAYPSSGPALCDKYRPSSHQCAPRSRPNPDVLGAPVVSPCRQQSADHRPPPEPTAALT